ncbi:hypothetical protein K474DRAFT_1687014 [Panus rudis PR-1116 ss-1]|nr:hypothetical protein K474DRAFT_1687014 [Panus rudis PR-1116 ss-1]
MSMWRCPLCELHGRFATQDMLTAHLRWDHAEVGVLWSKLPSAKDQWLITLTIPEVVPSESESDDDTENDDNSIRSINEVSDDDDDVVEIPPSPYAIARPPQITTKVEPKQISVQDTKRESAPEPIAKDKFRDQSPPFRLTLPRPEAPQKPPSYRGSLPERYPSPPPPSNPHGPAIQYPYLLPGFDEDGPEAHSFRPGGPRLLDLLNDLPLTEYGILSWIVVDREEDLFEVEDVRDEDKVMLALWNRWITLHSGYAKGIRAFLDQYWLKIHRAAGWGALRAFLLMMRVQRYLTIADVAALLRYYEEKTGMALWYKHSVDLDQSD